MRRTSNKRVPARDEGEILWEEWQGSLSARDTRIVSREWRERGILRVTMREQALGVDDGLDEEPGAPRLDERHHVRPVEMQ